MPVLPPTTATGWYCMNHQQWCDTIAQMDTHVAGLVNFPHYVTNCRKVTGNLGWPPAAP